MQSHTHDLSFTDTEVRKRFLHWADGEAEREWGCLRVIWENAPGLAPRPLRQETAGDHPVVIMERLPGDPLGGSPLTTAQTTSLGAALRRLYDIPLDAVVAAGIGERSYGPSALPVALMDWFRQPHDLSACRDPAQIRRGIDAAQAWLETPGALPVARRGGLGIADLNPANILWDGQTCRLIDFEDAGITDPAYDLADHVEHIAARHADVFDPEALAAAVGLSDEERDRMRAYRPVWAAFWLVMLLPGHGGFHRNPPGSAEAQALHLIRLIG